MRGSYVVTGSSFRRFGCSSTCCEVVVDGRRLIFDAGSGIIPLGREIIRSKDKNFSLFFTHFHIDHFFGMNYFSPLYYKDCEVAFLGPIYGKGSLKKNLEYISDELIHPVKITTLPCKKHFIDIKGSENFIYKDGKVRPYRKKKLTNREKNVVIKTLHNTSHSQLGVINYRIEFDGKVFVFATDIECNSKHGYNEQLVAFANGADFLAMDGQYTDDEYSKRKGWGHSTYKMACRTAELAEVKQLAIIHHDPEHNDKFLAEISRELKTIFRPAFLAKEGMEIKL